MSTKKKILVAVLLLIIVIGLAYLIYYLFFRMIPPMEITNQTTTPINALPSVNKGLPPGAVNVGQNAGPTPPAPSPTGVAPSTIARGGLTKTTTMTDTYAYNITTDASGKNIIYYNKDQGKFYQVNKDGKATPFSNQIFYDAQNITWSPDKNKAIITYPDGSNIMFDFNKNQQITLPPHWKEFNFSPDSNRIVFKNIGLDANNRWLAVANADGSQAQQIIDLGENGSKVQVAWSPNSQMVALYPDGQNFNTQNLLFIGLQGENFKGVAINGQGFYGLWNKQGDRILYSVYSPATNYTPELWAVDAQGDNIGLNRKDLKLGTWANKCVFSDNNTAYCAVPQTLEEGVGMVPEVADSVPDNFYRLDINTGVKSLIATTAEGYTVDQITVSQDGSYLYFTDKASGLLHKIQLK